MQYYKRSEIELLGYKDLLDEQNTSTVEIYVAGGSVHQLDADFIPVDNVSIVINDLGKLQSSGGADWNSREGDPGHILNRTHYKDIVNVLKEEHKANPETGQDYPETIYPEWQYPGTETSPECFGWNWFYDDQYADGGTGGIKISSLMEVLADYPEGTVFNAVMNIYDPNLDKTVNVEEEVKLHKIFIDLDDGEGNTSQGNIYELCADYFHSAIPTDPDTGEPGPFAGPGLYLGVGYVVDTVDSGGQVDEYINANGYLGLHEQYFTTVIDKGEFEEDSPADFTYNVDFSKETTFKLSKEYLPQTANWDETDSNSPDFILNRTHYKVPDTQENIGGLTVDGDPDCDTPSQLQTESGHDFMMFQNPDYIYEDPESDNTMYSDLLTLFTQINTLYIQGVRKLNLRLDDKSDFVIPCNIIREQIDENHQHYINYYLTADDVETLQDMGAVFESDMDSQGNTQLSKGVLFQVGSYSYDQV